MFKLRNPKKNIILALSLIILFSISIHYTLGSSKTYSTTPSEFTQAENAVNQAYEQLILIESYGLNATQLRAKLNEAVNLLNKAASYIGVNDSAVINFSQQALIIANSVYDDSQEILSEYETLSGFSEIAVYIGVILSAILVLVIVYYFYEYYKNKKRKEFFEGKIVKGDKKVEEK